MRDIRAVVTDLDGTVVDEQGRVSAATVRAAAGLAVHGVPLIVATARTSAWVAALEPLVSWVTVAVCCGGAIGWAPETRKMLWRETFPTASVAKIVRLCVPHLPDTGIAAYDGEQWRVTDVFATLGPTRRGPVEIVTPAEIAGHPVCALSVCHRGSSPDDLLRVLAADAQSPLTMASPAGNVDDIAVIDIAPAGTDKAAGVTRALAEVGIDPAHAVAFGDMLNDLPMFALCGYSIAVANAHPDVIDAATAVAACVHDDGFARTLGELGLASGYSAPEARRGPGCAWQPPAGGSRAER